jgi:predicted nucleic acid-binding protein
MEGDEISLRDLRNHVSEVLRQVEGGTPLTWLGVLTATTLEAKARRMAALRLAESLEPLPVDDRVADAWAVLVAGLRAAGRRAPVNDSWIAATAIARGMPVATQDDDYEGMPGLDVIRL